MTEIRVTEVGEQRVASIREVIPMERIRDFFDAAFRELAQVVQAQDAVITGPPFARYRGRPAQTVDVEVGFPVAQPVPGDGRVRASTLPAARTVQAEHVGPYEGLADTYDEVHRWIGEHHLTATDEMWEIYLTGPESGSEPASWRTQVVQPIV